MVTAEIITGGISQGSWLGIAIFFFLMWGVMILFNEKKRRVIKKLRKRLGVK